MKIEDACFLAGVSESSYHYWRQIGNKDQKRNKKTLHSRFLESTKKARLLWKKSHIRNIDKAKDKDWKASTWLLSHQFPEEFGDKAMNIEIPEELHIKITSDVKKAKK